MPLSLREAAQQADVSKSTVLRAIQSGRMSATRTNDGGWSIDPAELFRVYPPRNASQRSGNGAMGQDAPLRETAASDDATALRTQVELLREMLARADRQADDLRAERDRWQEQAATAMRLIPDQRPRSWWKRLAG